MTSRKSDIKLKRTPQYVSRETGAAELEISPATWDEMVTAGMLPAPTMVGIAGTTPRWYWPDVVAKLGGGLECNSEPYFRGLAGGQTKERKRVAS